MLFQQPIALISNNGTIKTPDGFHGINNAAIINKVVNAQGAGNVAGPLTYTGILPVRYEIIVKSPTDYGILAVGSVSGPMAFGIYNGDIEGIASSILTATTYTSVLQGFADLNNISGLTGTFADSFNYAIIQQSESTSWDLVVTAMTLPEITTGNSVELSNVGITVEPVFNGGTLLLSSGDQSSLAFDILTNGGFITAPDTGNALLSGVLSGTGALTFNGLATTIVSGANTYSGGTTVSTGTLQGDTSSLQGAIVNNSSVVFDQATDGTYASAMSGTGGLTKSGDGVLTLTGLNTYSGGTTVSAGSIQGDTSSLQGVIVNNSSVVFDQATDGTYASAMSGTGGLTKSGDGVLTLTGLNTYSGGTTVTTGTLQGDTSSLQGVIVNNSSVVFDQATDGTYASVMSGTGGLLKQNIGTLTLTGLNTYSGGTTVSAGSIQGDTSSLQGAIVNNSSVVFDQATDGTYTSAMSGTGGLTKSGNGVLTLTGLNTYSGGTTVTTGTLLGDTSSLQGAIVNNSSVVFDQATDGTYASVMSGTGSLLKQNIGTLTLTVLNTYSGGTTVSAGTLQGNTSSLQGAIVNNSSVVFDQATDGTYTSAMSGTGGLTKSGDGVLTLTGLNTYSGGSTVSTGTLQGDTTSLQGAIVNNSSVVFDQATDGTYASAMSGTGSLLKQNIGTLTLTGLNTYSGGSTVSTGTLQGDTSSLQGAIVNNSSVVFDQATDGTYTSAMSGTGVLTKSGNGVLTLTGLNTYSGGTTVTTGTLLGDTSSLQGAIVNNSSVVFDQATDGTYTSAMSGTGGLTKSGDGVLTLTGLNTYSGGTTVSAGSLSIAGTSPTGSGSVTIDHGAALSGRGVILGKVFVAGSLKPGNSPGFMTVMSDVSMQAGSSYLQDIAGTVQANDNSLVGATGYYSYLNVQGGAFIIKQGANLVPQLTNLFSVGQSGYGSNAYIPTLGDRFRIITAEGGIEGKFSGIIQPEGLDSGTSLVAFYNIQNSKSIDLAVIPSSYQNTIAAGSKNKNAISIGAVLDQIARANQSGTASQSQDQLLNAIASQGSARGIADYAQSLSGEVYAATVAVSAQTTQRLQQTIRGQLGLAYLTSPIEGRLGLAANTSQPSNNSQKAGGSGLVWGNATFQRGVRSSDDNAGGWNNNLYQLAFGSDFYTSERVEVGGGFSLSNSTLSPTYGSATIQQGSIFAYGKFLLQEYVVDAVASIGLSSSDISRSDVTGLSNGFRDTSVSGKDAMLSLGLSRPIELKNLFLTPYAQVSWQGALQRGVNEGDTPAALNVGRFTGNAVRGVLGLGLGSKGTNPSIDKYTYGAYVGVGADSSNLLNPTLNASLANINIDISTPIAGKFFVQAGLYGTIRVSKGTFAYLGLYGEAREQQTLGTINIGLRALF